MPKTREQIKDLFPLLGPAIPDERTKASSNSDLVQMTDEDDIAFPIGSRNTDDDVDLSRIFLSSATANTSPGTTTGVGVAPDEHLRKVVTFNGAPQVAKIQTYRRGTFSLAPLGMVFTTVAAAYNINQFQTFGDAHASLSGDPTKLAAFQTFEAALVRRCTNAVNRELDYSNGNDQDVRLANIFFYERDLGWLQEIVNGVARFAGRVQDAIEYQSVSPTYLGYDRLNSPDFMGKVKLLAKLIAQYYVIDDDFHATLQFMNDYHVNSKKNIRIPTINKKNVLIHNPCLTDAGVHHPEVSNVAPIPSRLTASDYTMVAATSGNDAHYYDLPTTDYVDALLTRGTLAEANAAMDEILTIAGALNSNYAPLLKWINTVVGKKIAAFETLDKYLYFNGEIEAVKPYYSYIMRAMEDGLPIVGLVDNVSPRIYAKHLYDFTTGNVDTSEAQFEFQYGLGSNVVRAGILNSDKVDNQQELFLQCWVPYDYATEGMVGTALFRFVNPFNGLCFVPQVSFLYIIDGSSCGVAYSEYNITASATATYLKYGVRTEQLFDVITYTTHSVDGACDGMVSLTVSGVQASDTVDKNAEIFDKAMVYNNCIRLGFVMRGAEDTVGETGFLLPFWLDSEPDSFLVPYNASIMANESIGYYSSVFPSIDINKSNSNPTPPES